MCRLLGVVSKTPIAVADAVGDARPQGFRRADARSTATAGASRPSGRLGQYPRSRCRQAAHWTIPRFAAATHDQRSAASLVHLRWATNGLAVRPENSHPFLADGFAMAHNGSIKPIDGCSIKCSNPTIAATLRGYHRQRALLRA